MDGVMIEMNTLIFIVSFVYENYLYIGGGFALIFIIAELIINILFLSVSSLSGKALAISQAVVVSTLLLSLIIIVSLFKDEK